MSLIRLIRKSTFALKKNQHINNSQHRLNFLMRLMEQNVGLQKIQFKPDLNFNTSVFKKGNPFFFVRKNFKKLFWNYLQKGFLFPSLLKFLHLAYWPSNSSNAWRMYSNYHGLERKQRIHFVQPTIPKLSYFFSLIFKKTYINNLLFFKHPLNTPLQNNYFNRLQSSFHFAINKLPFKRQLKPLSFSRKKKKPTFIISNFFNKFTYLKTPRFLILDRTKKLFKDFFFITYRQRRVLKNLITFYFPIISLVIKESNIHSLPMKTKKPRRV